MSSHNSTEMNQLSRQMILSSELNEILVHMDDSFNDVLTRVEEELLRHADACSTDKERTLIWDAHANLRKKRGEVKVRFKTVFHEMVQQAMEETKAAKAANTAKISLDGVDWTELKLVEDSALEEDVVVSRLAGKMKNAAEWELQDLNARMSFLMGREDPDETINPLRPELFCRALGQACNELDADHQTRMEVMRVFETALSERVRTVYHELNARLIQRNVLPRIKLRTIPKPSNRPAAKSGASDVADGTAGGGGGGAAGGPGNAGGGNQNITPQEALNSIIENTLSMFEVLQNLVQHNDAAQEGGVETPAVTQSRRHLYGAIHDLRQVQSANFGPISLDDFPDLQDITHGALAGGEAAVIPNFIWSNREQLRAAAPNHVDRITIDIVAMLFDQILADDKLPNDIKLLIGRLQMPVLRVALSDPAFFASRAHPARRLIDRISSCAIGYERAGSSNERFFKTVEELVLEVLRSAEDDSELYEALLNRFEAFLEQEKAQEDNDIVGKAADLLERAETREGLGINATIQINKLLFGLDIDPLVRNFLLDTWSQVIAEAACNSSDPEHDEQVAAYKQVVMDLVWSTQPKNSPERRKDLVALLPDLIGAIRRGMQLIGHPPAQETEFFSNLMQLHSEAVRTVGAETLPRINIEQFAERLKDLVFRQEIAVSELAQGELSVSSAQAERILAEQNVAIDFVKPAMREGQVALDIDDATLNEWVTTLERGHWLSMNVEGAFCKVRLAWVSPLKTFYLFSSHQNKRGHSFSAETLRQMFRNGDLARIEDENLIERSVRSVMTELEKNKGKPAPRGALAMA